MHTDCILYAYCIAGIVAGIKFGGWFQIAINIAGFKWAVQYWIAILIYRIAGNIGAN